MSNVLAFVCLGLIVVTFTSAVNIDVPDPPGRPVVIDIRADRCTISYEAPLSDGGSKITGYLIESRKEWHPVWQRAGVTSELQFTLVNLEPGTSIKFRVRASNAAGLSAPSETSDFITLMDPHGH